METTATYHTAQTQNLSSQLLSWLITARWWRNFSLMTNRRRPCVCVCLYPTERLSLIMCDIKTSSRHHEDTTGTNRAAINPNSHVHSEHDPVTSPRVSAVWRYHIDTQQLDRPTTLHKMNLSVYRRTIILRVSKQTRTQTKRCSSVSRDVANLTEILPEVKL